MVDTTILSLSPSSFVPDNDAQLVAGDAGASYVPHNGALVWAFDDTDEEAIISHPFIMPTQFAAGTTKAKIHFYTASDTTNDIALDVFVEAVTPDTDTLDLETATGWDSANAGTKSVSGTTAGDLMALTITLTNKDSVAAGDRVRIGIRRDTDSANDDATGDMFITAVEILEDV